jgi:hypothetical protein
MRLRHWSRLLPIVCFVAALSGQEVSDGRQDPALARIRSMLEQAAAARSAGKIEGARAILREALQECLQVPGLDGRREVHLLLSRVGRLAYDAADPTTAHDAWQRVSDYRMRTLGDDHPAVQAARSNLARAKMALGDLAGVRELEEKVFEVRSRTLADDDPALQRARGNLVSTKWLLGDLSGARALAEKVHEVFSRTLADDHPDLQRARGNLALMKHTLGDLAGAGALFEKVHAVLSRKLPEGHADLQRARLSLALTKRALGDLAGAHEVLEKVCEIFGRTVPDDHSDLQAARLALAVTRHELGDLVGARALAEQVCEGFGRTLPDDHPDLQRARLILAAAMHELGDLAGARALREEVYESFQRTLPDDHPDLQTARSDLAATRAALGDVTGTVSLARERGAAARRRLSSWMLAPREIGVLAAQELPGVDLLLTLAAGCGGLPAQLELAADALTTSQVLRAVQTRAARASRRAHAADPQRAATLEGELRAAAAEVSRVAGETVDGEGEGLESARRARTERLSRAVREKERVESELMALAAQITSVAAVNATARELAAALPERSAAAAIVGYTHSAADREHGVHSIAEPRLAALVLDRAGALTLCRLGAPDAVEEQIALLRAIARDGGNPLNAAKALRALVLDPILGAAGDIDALWLSVDDALELLPLDGLPREDGEPVGATLALRPLVSLFELLEPAGVEVGERPSFLAIGGLDYDAAGKDALAIVGDAIAPTVEDARTGKAGRFRRLPASAIEIDELALAFAAMRGAGRVRILRDGGAGKAEILADAPGAAFLHIATHGYFTPESVRSTADRSARRDPFAPRGMVSGLSPLALCGLALSGANIPADDLGRHAGILTAEEILSLDLSRCYLATLSACDTSLGVRRAGQGYASLRAALQGAGARFVVTSLWKVSDEATKDLMLDFYRRLWVQKEEPHTALWEAKMEARRKGAAFRDWAGWVLTGR